jgi:long-chain acyl-CoA synthetase
MIISTLRSSALENPEAPSLRDERTALTRRDFDSRVEAFAEQLQELGVGNGDVVAVMLPNRVEVVVAIAAAWRLGATATPVNPAFTVPEAEQQLSDSGAKVVVRLDQDGPEFPGCVSLAVDQMRRSAIEAVATVEPAAQDVALLVYTSGSTGTPKGVMLTHANIDAMTEMIVQHLELGSNDHCFLVMPLFHVNALLISVLAPLRVGGQVSIREKFSARTFLGDVEALRPTYFSAVPTVYAVLVDRPLEQTPDVSSVRFVICGAAPVSASLLEACHRRFGFEMLEGYGLTESTCVSALNPLRGTRKLGTVGPALAGQEIVIVAPDGSRLPPGERGEVTIAGPTVMKGYLNRPTATAETLRDGWLHTGDVGILDEDGYLTLVDRLKDMIIRGGENLYPTEIEHVLSRHPDVLEAAVVGQPHPVLGETPVAWVTLRTGADVSAAELDAHCRRYLTQVKVPAHIHITPGLPRNPVGKIDKPHLRVLLQSAEVESRV